MQYFNLIEIGQISGLGTEKARGKIRRHLAKHPKQQSHTKKVKQENGGAMGYYSAELCAAIFEGVDFAKPKAAPEPSPAKEPEPEPKSSTPDTNGEILFLRNLADNQSATIQQQNQVIGYLTGQITELRKLAAPVTPQEPSPKDDTNYLALFIFSVFLFIALLLIFWL